MVATAADHIHHTVRELTIYTEHTTTAIHSIWKDWNTWTM
jgi:hypothetical protein